MQSQQYHLHRPHALSNASDSTSRTAYTSSFASSTAASTTNQTSISSLSSSSPRLPNASTTRSQKRANTHPDPIHEGLYCASPTAQPTMPSTTTVTASPTFAALPKEKIHLSKAKIKPLWKLATAHGRSSRNSLDLSQSGGGEQGRQLGLGIYRDEDVYGDLEAFPRQPRNFAGSTGPGFSHAMTVGGFNRNGYYVHPKRQFPRPYTPTPNPSCHPSEDSEDDDVEEDVFNPSRGYYSGEYSRKSSLDYSRTKVHQPSLRLRTDTSFSSPVLRSATSQSHSQSPISPITPLTAGHSAAGFFRPSLKHGTNSASTTRDPSPSFAASVTAARLAWDAKEAKREEKHERKRRKSEQREREKMEHNSSRVPSRGRAGSGNSIWEERVEESADNSYAEKVEAQRERTEINVGTGKKWGLKNFGGTREKESSYEKRRGSTTGGLKKKWLGFVVWLRIGLLKVGRKFSNIGGKKRKRN